MDIQTWTFIIVGLTFSMYIGIAIWAKVGSTHDFYIAGKAVSPIANGMATAADWMSAASFISMAGLISFLGYDGSVYLMGWTGGYVLLALLLAPYLRKFGKFTIPDFVGDRYYSNWARIVAILCAVFISFTYVAGQMRGVGIVFSRFLDVDITTGVIIGMIIVFFYSVLGGMKGITYTQVAQYCVLIFAYLLPAVYISLMLTNNPIPQLALGGTLADSPGIYLLDRLDGLMTELGFDQYTDGSKPKIDVLFITAALMLGTAGLPHVIIRFFTVPKVRDARLSAGYALICIVLLYSTAPAVAAFAKLNILDTTQNVEHREAPEWFHNWESIGLVSWVDRNNDERIQYHADPEINELNIDPDIIVLASPEIAQTPNWLVGLVVAGGLAAALSTTAGLLLVLSTAFAHDFLKRIATPALTEKGELRIARITIFVAVLLAGHLGVNPPGFVAETVAFAFGLAASSIFPVIIMGIFYKRMNREGAIAGMLTGIIFTSSYIIFFTYINPGINHAEYWLFGISPEGIGTVGMLLNFAVALTVVRFTAAPPDHIQYLVEKVRVPQNPKHSEHPEH
ncbi:MAG: sodium:solute symporter family protein [Balneolales bacterium]